MKKNLREGDFLTSRNLKEGEARFVNLRDFSRVPSSI